MLLAHERKFELGVLQGLSAGYVQELVCGHESRIPRRDDLGPGALYREDSYAVRPWNLTDAHALKTAPGAHAYCREVLFCPLKAVYRRVISRSAKKAGE